MTLKYLKYIITIAKLLYNYFNTILMTICDQTCSKKLTSALNRSWPG